MIRVRCQCGKSLKLPPEHLNRSATCPHCRTRVRIVAAEQCESERKAKGRFIVESGPRAGGEQIFLAGTTPIDVGKAESAHLRLLATSVSRRHCRLVQIDRGWRIEDLGSTNGIFVNGRQVRGHNLLNGDVVRIGDFDLRYEYEPTKRSTDDLADDSAADPDSGIRTLWPDPTSASGFHFLDDTGTIVSRGPAVAAAAAAGGTKSRPPAPPKEDESDDLFAFAPDHDIEAGPPISLPVDPKQVKKPPASDARVCPNCSAAVAPGARICVACGTDLASGKRMATDTGEIPRARPAHAAVGPFFAASLRSFGFIADPGSVVTFLILAAITSTQPLIMYAGPCLALIGMIVIQGWIAAYLFNTVLTAANGEADVPDISLTEGWIDGIFAPFFKFLCASIFAMVPAFAYVLIMATNLPSALKDPGLELVGFILLGLFFWPMFILALALAGVGTIFRFDLMVRTVMRTLVPYVIVCAFTLFAVGVAWFAQFGLPRVSGLGGGMAAEIIARVVGLYFWIVAMRCIGLYYHHFKDRFAWSWG